MKANKAPEKIWIDLATDLPKLSGHIDKDSVEYTRTDAFIEKAVEWWVNNFVYTDDAYTKYETIEDFRNYLKAE